MFQQYSGQPGQRGPPPHLPPQQVYQPQIYSQVPQHHSSQRRSHGPPSSSYHTSAVQMQAQHEAQRAAMDQARRKSKKPTDKNMPEGVEDCIVGDGVQRYRQLKDLERKLDAAMTRKRMEIQNSHDSNVKIYRTLRIWISNTVEDQPWQTDPIDVNNYDFSANSDASYRVEIKGRLVDDILESPSDDDSDDDDNVADHDAMEEDSKGGKKPNSMKLEEKYRFSHFFKAMTVDYDKTRNKDENVEWKKPSGGTNAGDLDQICFKRGGDENVNITINLTRDETPERFQLSKELTEIMDVKEATKAEVVTGIWEYVKMMELQEDEEKRSFRCDELLKQIYGRDTGFIPLLSDAINPHLKPQLPLQLKYTIRCDQEFQKNPQPTIYDVRVPISDPLVSHLSTFNNPSVAPTLREISALNDELALYIQRIGESKAKHDFLSSLAREPGAFINKWMSSQKRDMEVIIGDALRGGGEDACSDEFRRGGADGVWGSQHLKDTVKLMLSTRSRG